MGPKPPEQPREAASVLTPEQLAKETVPIALKVEEAVYEERQAGRPHASRGLQEASRPGAAGSAVHQRGGVLTVSVARAGSSRWCEISLMKRAC